MSEQVRGAAELRTANAPPISSSTAGSMDNNAKVLTAARRSSSRAQRPNASTHALPAQDARPGLHKQPSSRLRPPTATDQNAGPSSSWTASSHAERLRRPSKMSLFNLFRNPKVETQHAHVEPKLSVVLKQDIGGPTLPTGVYGVSENTSTWPTSSSSTHSASTKPSRPVSSRTPSPPLPHGGKLRKNGPFEHPPLFQVYPQAVKEGTVGVSSIPVEALNKARLQESDRTGFDSQRASVLPPSPSSPTAASGLPKKIFVLVTSGYLLQYAETGPSDRLPEKVLSLGKDSAAFACDAIAGKHYVLQISHAVDRDGIVVPEPSSFFARLGMRNAAEKRMTCNFVIVLRNASEMDAWMTAIREEIDVIRGVRRQPEATRAPIPLGSLSTPALHRAPSHRYQVKRDPHRITPVSSPIRDTFALPLPVIPPSSPMHDMFALPPRMSPAPSPVHESFPPLTKDANRRSEALTIDNIEMEANELDAEPIDADGQMLPPAPTSPLNSIPSSGDPLTNGLTALSEPSSHIKMLPSQERVHTPSQRPASSRLSLGAGSCHPWQADGQCDLPSLPKPGFSSLNFSRKAPPAPLTLQPQILPAVSIGAAEEPIKSAVEPSILERTSPSPPAAQELADSQATIMKSKHDSKICSTSPSSEVQALATEDADGVGKLPESFSLASARSNAPLFATTARSNGSRRVASFSMPLKINPANTSALLPSGNPRRHSRMDEPGQRSNTFSVGLAITPSAALPSSVPSSYFEPANAPLARPSSSSESTSPTSRLSLFPLATPLSTNPPDALQPTGSAPSSHITAQAMHIAALKRPTSMQVRSDHAPFLSSVRTSPSYGTLTTGLQAAAPIRGMKPSRPASAIETLPLRQSSLEALKALRFDSPIAEEEASNLFAGATKPTLSSTAPSTAATELPGNPPPPMVFAIPKAAGSRSSVRKSRHKHSPLPNLDFGIPLIGLGPPAPPPQMPLPAPPTMPMAASPVVMHSRHVSIEHAAGLGISVS